MPKVYNVRDFSKEERNKRIKDGTLIYVGRYNSFYNLPASPFANEFVIPRDGSRDEVIKKYISKKSKDKKFMVRVKKELKGRDILCWCSPDSCHGDWLLEVANK